MKFKDLILCSFRWLDYTKAGRKVHNTFIAFKTPLVSDLIDMVNLSHKAFLFCSECHQWITMRMTISKGILYASNYDISCASRTRNCSSHRLDNNRVTSGAFVISTIAIVVKSTIEWITKAPLLCQLPHSLAHHYCWEIPNWSCNAPETITISVDAFILTL